MSEFERTAKSNKCVLVALATSKANPFYEKLGYVSTASYYKKYLE
ncbi:MAG: GNAT family N-acetyltransferase [Pricia sp.]|nr:GNAT family N-acetyltransferase [Pricia sp.]